ncbi:MAG: hypothetical protein D8M58_21315 [Calditrichaeota bacterium]|nr:MAG: hypothetical protein DWQ03_00040 [Calditrichota bacterium]MBL1207953.1 hypothetical protein [Calditrichota bacterium]NOG47790.1 hypothetical protein [Calditrichota bacterium]
MNINWKKYEEFDWNSSSQTAMNNNERMEIAEIAKDMLELNDSDMAEATPPGRFAATVIHPYECDLGIKIYKNNDDGRRQANRAMAVYLQDIEKLPGLPSDNVQKIIRADRYNKDRNYIIQEWISGDSLEYLQIKNAIEPAHIRPIVEQLFLNIIIPLWTKGTVWWDSRDGNYCFDANTKKLTLIDIDSLTTYYEEITETPDVWLRRERGRAFALPRLRQMVLRLLQTQGLDRGMQKKYRAIWDKEFLPILKVLGREITDELVAVTHFHHLMSELETAGLLKV